MDQINYQQVNPNFIEDLDFADQNNDLITNHNDYGIPFEANQSEISYRDEVNGCGMGFYKDESSSRKNIADHNRVI